MRALTVSLATTLSLLAAASAQAASSTSSLVSDSITTSVGSVSTSFKKSSDGSSGPKNAAAGDYTVTDMVAVADQPTMLQLTLAAVPGTGAEGTLTLLLPRQAAERGQLATGKTVSAAERPYGLEFATTTVAAAAADTVATATRQAFFLVLADAWYQELSTRQVRL